MTPPPFGHVLTAMVTPMTPAGEVDLDGAASLARWLTRPGWNDGLVINGTTGESATTSDAEKDALLRTVVEAVDPRVTVVAGVGSADTRHTIELARAAERAGARGVLMVTPYYLRPSQDGVLHHFRAVADATSLPVMLYDIPRRTGTPIAPETLARAAEHERIVAVKDAKGDLEATTWLLRETALACYSGEDALNLPLLSVGAVGFVSVLGHLAADRLARMRQAHAEGDNATALALHRGLLPLCRGLFRIPAAAATKAALGMLGLPGGPVRPPLLEAADDEARLLRDDLVLAGVDASGGGLAEPRLTPATVGAGT